MLSLHSRSLLASGAVAPVLDLARRLAASPYPLLILGDRGTGKSLLARQIHRWSGRPGDFVAESAANIPDGLAEAHLAGHSRGAFTGAYDDRMGLFERAHTGTLFLDELGVASARVQESLLQYLDETVVCRLGDKRARPLDVRVVAATNADLEAMVRGNTFRADLLDRFGHMRIVLPSLAERREDILPLAEHLLAREAAVLGWSDVPEFDTAVRDCFMIAPWLGNVRELVKVCQFALVMAEPGRSIGMCDLPGPFLASLGETTRARLAKTDRRAEISDALARTHGNKTRAAKLLGVSVRQFYRLLAQTATALVWLSVAP